MHTALSLMYRKFQVNYLNALPMNYNKANSIDLWCHDMKAFSE